MRLRYNLESRLGCRDKGKRAKAKDKGKGGRCLAAGHRVTGVGAASITSHSTPVLDVPEMSLLLLRIVLRWQDLLAKVTQPSAPRTPTSREHQEGWNRQAGSSFSMGRRRSRWTVSAPASEERGRGERDTRRSRPLLERVNKARIPYDDISVHTTDWLRKYRPSRAEHSSSAWIA